jgi:hypothetical protein
MSTIVAPSLIDKEKEIFDSLHNTNDLPTSDEFNASVVNVERSSPVIKLQRKEKESTWNARARS